MGAADASGLEVTVCYFPGGVGHIGVGVSEHTRPLVGLVTCEY